MLHSRPNSRVEKIAAIPCGLMKFLGFVDEVETKFVSGNDEVRLCSETVGAFESSV